MKNLDSTSWLNVWDDLLSSQNTGGLSRDDSQKLDVTFTTLFKVAKFLHQQGGTQKLSDQETLLDKLEKKRNPSFGNEALKENHEPGLILSETEEPQNQCHRYHDMINEFENTPQTLSSPKEKRPTETPKFVSMHGLDKNEMEIEEGDAGALMNNQGNVEKQKPNLLKTIPEYPSPTIQTIATQENCNTKKDQQPLIPLKSLEKSLDPEVEDFNVVQAQRPQRKTRQVTFL